ncbi:MAG: ABC transporter permease [Chloroflexi bacterium]|nr:ABC transporter permease [Chloroflexota bacterium]
MSFTALIFKNLLRQRIRTSLTVVGIGLGIATVVALGSVVGGMKQTAGQILTAYGSDFIVAEKGASDLSFSNVAEADQATLAEYPGVAGTLGILLRLSKVGGNPYFVTVGMTAVDVEAAGIDLREGTLYSSGARDEILLGTHASNDLDAGVGDSVVIDDQTFHVVGLFKSSNLWQDSGAIAPLATVQELANKAGVVTFVYVRVAEGADPEAVAAGIRDDFALLTTVANVSEYSRVDQGIEIMDALNLAVQALAVGIGAIGVMNTMVMSVYERTREIGILRAVGWSDNRVLRMIVGESLILCAIAAVVGALAGVAASRAVLLIPAVQSLLTPTYTSDIFVRGLVVALAVALVGAAYPAVRAIRLVPMEALRHE